MRHGRKIRKLGVKAPHRKAMLSNMANSLISVGKIQTTTARAKVLQGQIDRLVTLAKRGDLHARRQALSELRNRETVTKLFTEIAPEFKNINGGYTRRMLNGRRLGDGASLSVLELNIEKKIVEEPKKKKGKEAETEGQAEGKVKEEKKETKPAAKEKKAKKPKAEKSPKPEKKTKPEKKKKEKAAE